MWQFWQNDFLVWTHYNDSREKHVVLRWVSDSLGNTAFECKSRQLIVVQYYTQLDSERLLRFAEQQI